METTAQTNYKKSYVTGIAFITISFLIYLLAARASNSPGLFSGIFFLNYILGIAYLFILLVDKKSRPQPRPNIDYRCWVNVVILFTISAFSLNKEMRVFAEFPTWLNIYSVLSLPLFLLFPFFKRFPAPVKAILFLLTGLSLTLSVYMFIYLLPLFPFSVIASLAFGISLHSFVPGLWLWLLFDFLLRKTQSSKLKLFVIPGILIPMVFLAIYLNKWDHLQTEIKDLVAEQNIKLDHKLPTEIYLAQKLPSDVLTEEILVAPFKSQKFWSEDFTPMNNNSAKRYHNPLSIIAVGMFGPVGIDERTSETILNIRRDFRHQTTRKLWTGSNLNTSAVSNNIQVFPKYRLAYHEKTFVIHNDPYRHGDFWFTTETQEALYTFHVPEGSIVTSLSLWINGKEQKSRLTTLQKADSAYQRIVGVENRDPALVHWQEGNKISVRIFPCTPTEDRTFKIGFTTPLKLQDNNLVLENIWFEGPDYKQAREVTQILLTDNAKPTEVPVEFEPGANGNYFYKGDYHPYWKISFANEALSKSTFQFAGFSYALQEAQNTVRKAEIKTVFLDLNCEWSRAEYDKAIAELGSKEIITWLPEKTTITNANKDLVWNSAVKNQFSFPFLFDVGSPENTIVVTKTSHRSPVLSDLKQSEVAGQYTNYLADSRSKINVLNIGHELSPFWRSMRELRLINYNNCSLEEAIISTKKGEIASFTEDSTKVIISDSKLLIVKTPCSDSTLKSQAPDHLLRLFAYNDVLRKLGPKYFEKEKYEDELFREAEEAYVVTPLTGMIVLESDEDYDRMGIKRNTNTVGNAGVLTGGAVPEPHEWLLIALVAFFIMRSISKKRQLTFNR